MPEERRKNRTLTDGDIQALKDALIDHPCRFPTLTPDEVEDVRRVVHVVNKVGDRVVNGVSWTIGALILGLVYLMATHKLWPGGK